MAQNRYATFYAAYNSTKAKGNPLTKEEQVREFTQGRTSSLQDLTDAELREIVTALNHTNTAKWQPTTPEEVKLDKMRKALIAQFHLMHRTPSNAIAWAEKQGVRGTKKKFNKYTTQELYVLIALAEKVVLDWQKAIRLKVANTMLN